MRRILQVCLSLVGLWFGAAALQAQAYVGITGLVHIPTAEMAEEGDVRAGSFFLPADFVPENMQRNQEIGRYNTFNYYLAITPFSWIELSYVCTFLKAHKNNDPTNTVIGYYQKDRHFNVKVRPLKEGRYWPALAIGAQDPGRSVKDNGDYAYFQNFYAVASKHVTLRGHELAAHVAYRYYRSDFNRRWRGVAGGITYRPAFAHNLRLAGEYTGDAFLVGVDCLLWRHLFLQASLQDGKHFVGGIRLQMNLF